MSVAGLIQISLMVFVLLAPTLMVAVLISGLSRRPRTDVAPALAAETDAADAVGVIR